jgi:hypothetical protein
VSCFVSGDVILTQKGIVGDADGYGRRRLSGAIEFLLA